MQIKIIMTMHSHTSEHVNLYPLSEKQMRKEGQNLQKFENYIFTTTLSVPLITVYTKESSVLCAQRFSCKSSLC